MDPELSKTSPLDIARTDLKSGNYDKAVQTAQIIISETPSSAAAYIILGDSQSQLGQHDQAYDAYRAALGIYRKRYGIQDDFSQAPEDQRDAAVRDMTATEERLIGSDIILGNYRDARTRSNRLARNGVVKYVDLMKKPVDTTMLSSVKSLIAEGHSDQAIHAIQEYLMRRGEADIEIELLLARALVGSNQNVSIRNISAAYIILRRLTAFIPDAQTEIDRIKQIVADHPNKEIVLKYFPDLIVEPISEDVVEDTLENNLNTGERVGSHGAILSELTLHGPIIDGSTIRQGRLQDRVVSDKSNESYAQRTLRELFSTRRDGDPERVDERILTARIQLANMLQLISASYLANNEEVLQNVFNMLRKNSDNFMEHDVAGAMQYLRFAVEHSWGNEVIEEEAKLFPNRQQHIALLSALLTQLKQETSQVKHIELDAPDMHNVTSLLPPHKVHYPDSLGIRKVIIETLPQGYTGDDEELDTLALGLTILELQNNRKAQEAYKLKQLQTRIQ